MANSKRRCNQCRSYVPAESMLRVGSVWVCSNECRSEKLQATITRSQVQVEDDAELRSQKAETRAAVKERDGDFCLLCGERRDLHLHRVTYGSEGGEYQISNCVQLCSSCHNMGNVSVHASKRVWQPLLIAYLSDKPGALGALRAQYRAECRALQDQALRRSRGS